MNDSAKRILLVDDNTGDSEALTRRLQRLGYEVVSVEQGASPAAAAKDEDIDVALIDINLPIKEGFRVAEDVAASSAARVVFITGLKSPSVRDRAKALGASGFIEKPYTSAYLRMQLEHALAQQRDGTWAKTA
ncbi:MAG: response regulator [Gammaproteobacteria bacterium]|nr:response regulator [Gammaproteobacteria bacterium]